MGRWFTIMLFVVGCQSVPPAASSRYPTNERPLGQACEPRDEASVPPTAGPRDGAKAFGVIDDASFALRDCVQEGLNTVNPFMHGAVCLRIDIAPPGHVATAWIDGSELAESSVHHCILRELCELRFEPANERVVVSYPLVFYRREIDMQPIEEDFAAVCEPGAK